MRDQRHARRDQLRPGRLDDDVGLAVDPAEAHPVRRPRLLPVFELRLRDRGAVVDVPQRGRLRLVRLAPGEVPEERALRHALGALTDRRVDQRPVDRQPEPAPQLLERLLVDLRQPLAQLHEVRPRHRYRVLARLLRRLEIRVVRQRGVAPHPEVVLHPPLGGEPVVVPPHRIEDLGAAHTLVPDDRIRLRIPEHRPHVQRPADGRGRRVDRVDLLPRLRPVEPVRPVRVPPLAPARFEPVETRLLRNAGHAASLRKRVMTPL